MDGTVNRGARVECRVGQPIAAVAEPADFPMRRGAAIQAVRRPCVQRAPSRPARDTRSAKPTAVRTAAFWLAAGAGAATDGFLLDSALTCCLLTVWATLRGSPLGLGALFRGAIVSMLYRSASRCTYPTGMQRGRPHMRAAPASIRCQQKDIRLPTKVHKKIRPGTAPGPAGRCPGAGRCR
jgi:hypothetical protein